MKKQSKLTLLHVASSHVMGLTNQKTQLAIAYKALGDVNITVLSGEKEQVSGSFHALKAADIPFVTINGFDDHHDILRLIREFISVARNIKPDIVSVNTNWQILIAGIARWFGHEKYKIIYTVHGFRHNHPVKSIAARTLISILLLIFSDVIQAPTGYVRDKFALLKYKIKSVPLGEDDLFFNSSELPDLSKPLHFCFAGEFRDGKNQDMLIEAFAEYVAKTNDKQAMLFLPGEGALRPACMTSAHNLGIINQVVFPGQLDRREMVDIYKDCQIALVPTNTETFGHCIAEPLIMKRVVISRPVGIALDVIVAGVNGFLFNAKEDLVTALIHVKQMRPADLIKIAEQAGKVGERFSWHDVAVENVALLMKPLLKKA